MATYTLKAETGHYFISPFFFISYSEDFYQACRSHTSSRPFSPAQYYLACRSIELSLKAFLLLRGVTRKSLARSLGHDLVKILERCNALKMEELLVLTKEQIGHIHELNKWYARKGFEYFEIENLVADHNLLPRMLVVLDLANSLIVALKQPCKDEANKP